MRVKPMAASKAAVPAKPARPLWSASQAMPQDRIVKEAA
jgi:hypothetical protein